MNKLIPLLNVAHMIDCSDDAGPGKRFAIWVQGCTRRCLDCHNMRMQEIAPRQILRCDEIMQRIVRARMQFGIEGVTIFGGEPMLQARAIAWLAARCQEAGLSVMVFSRYTLAELQQVRPTAYAELLEHTDVLVGGPYLPHQRETVRNWVGSTNQQFYYLTGRYNAAIETDRRYAPTIEMRLDGNGLVVNGWT